MTDHEMISLIFIFIVTGAVLTAFHQIKEAWDEDRHRRWYAKYMQKQKGVSDPNPKSFWGGNGWPNGEQRRTKIPKE